MKINKKELLNTTKMWDGTKFSHLNINNPEVTVLKITVPVGQVLKMHKHPLVNIAYVKQGTLIVKTDDNKTVTVSEGECLAEVINKYHYGRNAGNIPLELVVFYIGEKGTPLSEDLVEISDN